MNQSEKKLRELAGRITHNITRNITSNIETPYGMHPGSSKADQTSPLTSSSPGYKHELSEIRGILLKLERKLNALETSSAPQLSHATIQHSTHPSQDKFAIGEAVSEMVDFFEGEKTCQMEPGGKPCDHCALCSSRGF
ncbi:MAG: hypothetical protein ACRD63_07785 [Pyrinomonadaceae bacterium]